MRRPGVGGAREVEAAGATIGDVLATLSAARPTPAGQPVTQDGELNQFVTVLFNGQGVRYLAGRAWRHLCVGTFERDHDETDEDLESGVS